MPTVLSTPRARSSSGPLTGTPAQKSITRTLRVTRPSHGCGTIATAPPKGRRESDHSLRKLRRSPKPKP